MGGTEQYNPNQDRPPHNETALERAERIRKEAEQIGRGEVVKKTERKLLKHQIENAEKREDHFYELGKYDGAKLEKDFNVVEGSVDATPYGPRALTPKVYKEKSEAAELLIKVYEKEGGKERFMPASQQLIEKHLDMLKKLGKEKNRATFEKGYSSDQLFSADGIYNFVLSFQRAIDAFPSADTLEKSDCLFLLTIGTTTKNDKERYVRTFVQKKKEGGEDGGGGKSTEGGTHDKPDETGTETGGEVDIPEEDLPNVKIQNGDYMVATTVGSNILPTANKFGEIINIDLDQESTNVIDSYTKLGIGALIEGLNRLPEAARGPVLERVFKNIGESDPEKGFLLMKEIIKNQKEAQESQLLDGLKEKIENAPENEKKYWQAQLALYEMGQLDANGMPKLEAYESQEKMRQALALLADVDINALPEELRQMAEKQKKYLDFTMRNSIVTDMVSTMNLSIDTMMKEMEDFIELKAESREDIKDDLDNMWDSDEEVYMSAKHMMEALRLLIKFQYPIDAQTQDIPDPLNHYYKILTSSSPIPPIKVPEGQSASMTDVLKDHPINITGPGEINLNELFVDRQEEARLFQEYQKGEEKLGEKGIWALGKDIKDGIYDTLVPDGLRDYTKYIAGGVGIALPWMIMPMAANYGGGKLYDYLGGERGSFMEKKDRQGGILDRSGDIFPKKVGDLSGFLKENPGGSADDFDSLGAVEKIQLEKIQHMFITGQFYEARALCIQILQKRLDQKRNEKYRTSNVDVSTPEYRELLEDHGEQIRNQAKLQLLQQGIDEKSFPKDRFPKPDGGFYTTLDEFVEAKIEDALKGRKYIDDQGVTATQFTDEEIAGFSGYEKRALELLLDLNGEGLAGGYLDLKEENAIIAKEITQLVVEIVIIEVVTWGAGTAAAAALTAARLGKMGARGLQVANMVAKASEVAAKVPRLARAGKTIAHAAFFTEAHAAMHGHLVDPTSSEGLYQIGLTAATFGMMRGMQGLARGTAEGMIRTVETGATGFSRLRQPLSQLQYLNRAARSSGKLGTVGAEVAEGFVEIGAIHSMSQLEQELAIAYNEYTGDKKGELEARIRDTDFWDMKELAHTAGVVIGLRGGRLGGEALGTKIGRNKFGSAENPNQMISIGKKHFFQGEAINLRPTTQAQVIGIEKVQIAPDKIATRLKVKLSDGTERVLKSGDVVSQSTSGDIKFGSRSFKTNEVIEIKSNLPSQGKVIGVETIETSSSTYATRFKVQLPNGKTTIVKYGDVVAPAATKSTASSIREFLSTKARGAADRAGRVKEAIGSRAKRGPKKVVELYGKFRDVIKNRSEGKEIRSEYAKVEKAQKEVAKELDALRKAVKKGKTINVTKRVKSIQQKAKDAQKAMDTARDLGYLEEARRVAEHKGVKFDESFKPTEADFKAFAEAIKRGEVAVVEGKAEKIVKSREAAKKALEEAQRLGEEARAFGLKTNVEKGIRRTNARVEEVNEQMKKVEKALKRGKPKKAKKLASKMEGEMTELRETSSALDKASTEVGDAKLNDGALKTMAEIAKLGERYDKAMGQINPQPRVRIDTT